MVEFAHSKNKKVYVTMNIVPHSSDLTELIEYLQFLESVNVTGIIISSLYISNKILSKTFILITLFAYIKYNIKKLKV